MFFHVDHHNGLAVYDQIACQVKFAIADGGLRAGEMIPSVRELARELAINPNTVARAYRQLQDEQVVEAVRGTGLSVVRGARRVCQAHRKQWVRQRVGQVFAEAAQSGLDTDEIKAIVRLELPNLFRQKVNR